MTPLRIALVDPAPPERLYALARGLAAAGHAVTVVRAGRPSRSRAGGLTTVRLPGLPGAPLRARKIGEQLEHVPAAALALRAGRFDVAHAFSPSGALATTWANERASVLSFAATVSREGLADRRLRLAVLERAVERSGMVLAATPEVERSLWRWLGVRARVLEPGDAAAHAAVYAEVAH